MIPTSTVRPTVRNEHYPDSLLSELFHYLNNKFFHDTGNSNNINKVPEEFFINLSASIVNSFDAAGLFLYPLKT